MAESNILVPTVDYSDHDDNSVRVCITIPHLKKKTLSSKPANGNVDFKPTKSSFNFSANVDVKGKQQQYQYNIKQLPADIDPEKCSWKVTKDEEVLIHLHKAVPSSWAGELSRRGLETAD